MAPAEVPTIRPGWKPAFSSCVMAPFSAMPFNPALVIPTKVGVATFTFADGNNATFAYTVQLADMMSSVTQGKAITREVFVAPGTVCQ